MSTGTAAWNGDVANGNHNWIEVWRPGAARDDSPNATRACTRGGGGCEGDGASTSYTGTGNGTSTGGGFWSPIEGLPAGGGESLDDPCTLWFCNPAKFPAPAGQVRAAIYNIPNEIYIPEYLGTAESSEALAKFRAFGEEGNVAAYLIIFNVCARSNFECAQDIIA